MHLIVPKLYNFISLGNSEGGPGRKGLEGWERKQWVFGKRTYEEFGLPKTDVIVDENVREDG